MIYFFVAYLCFILQFVDIEADALVDADTQHVVITESIFVSLDASVFHDARTLKNTQPHFFEPGACSSLGAMVILFLCEAANDARVLAVGGFLNCVVHIILILSFYTRG